MLDHDSHLVLFFKPLSGTVQEQKIRQGKKRAMDGRRDQNENTKILHRVLRTNRLLLFPTDVFLV
jgi:hypothetical protein